MGLKEGHRFRMVLGPDKSTIKASYKELIRKLRDGRAGDSDLYYRIGLFLGNLSIREFKLWWERGPRVEFTITTLIDVAGIIRDYARILGYHVRYSEKEEGFATLTFSEDYVRDMLKNPSPEGPTIAKIQRIVGDFMMARTLEEAESIIKNAEMMGLITSQ